MVENKKGREMMKRLVKAVLISMAILSMIYAWATVYATVNVNPPGTVYAALRYGSHTPPTDWYTPEQLGIVKIIEYGEKETCWLHVVIGDESFPLQYEQPVFMYKDKFYQISHLWLTPALHVYTEQWQTPVSIALGLGWAFTGALFINERKNRFTVEP